MRIGVISDTHGSLKYFERAIESIGRCDYILHAGDVLYHGPRNPLPDGYCPKDLAERINDLDNIIFASGNCDSDVDQMVISHPIQSPYAFVNMEKLKIMVCHGYKDSVENLIEYAKKMGANIFVFGHSHVKKLYKSESLVVLNPGSTSLPKDGTHSAAVIEDGRISLIDISNGDTIETLNI